MGAPLFQDPGADDYHITELSPAIDQGTDVGVADDYDGRRRPIGLPDIGADEWGLPLHLPLLVMGG